MFRYGSYLQLLIGVAILGVGPILVPERLVSALLPSELPCVRGFIRNGGQWPDSVLAVFQSDGVDVWFTRSGLIQDVHTDTNGCRVGSVMYTGFQGAIAGLVVSEVCAVPVTFITGSSGAAVATFASSEDQVHIVHTNGYVERYSISRAGNLVRDSIKVAEINAGLLTTETRSKADADEVQWNRSTVFTSGTYIGGPGTDEIAALETLPDGTILVAGSTTQAVFPESLGGYSRQHQGNSDGFLARIDASLGRVYRWTFIGGSGDDRIKALALDRSRNVCVVLQTDSYDMPVLQEGRFTKSSGGKEAYVTVLDSSLMKIITGVYHGGPGDDVPCCISVDVFDDIVIAGTTTSTSGLPTTRPNLDAISGFFIANGRKTTYSYQVPSGKYNMGESDGFLAVYSSSGLLRAARYYGGDKYDTITAMTTDKQGRIIFAGTTSSPTLITVPIVFNGWPGRVPYQRNYAGGALDGFIVKINRALQLTQEDVDGNFVSYFGGTGVDRLNALVLGRDQDIYFAGNTTSNGFYRSSSIQSAVVDKTDGYVSWLSSDGTLMKGFTYWGGSEDDEVLAVHADPASTLVLFGGRTYSEDFPVVGTGSKSDIGGWSDGFIAALDFQRSRFSTRIPGNNKDEVVAFGTARYGDALFALNSASTNLFVADSAIIRDQNGATGYLGRYSLGEVTLNTPNEGEIVCAGSTSSVSWKTLGLSDTVRYSLEYRSVGGDEWTTIIRGLRAKMYAWKVPLAIQPGRYEVRVTSQFGHISKTGIPVTIDVKPAVSIRTSSLRDCEGAPVRMVATAANVVAGFQWRRNGTPLISATDSVYVVNSLNAGNVGTYDCVVSGVCSASDTSKPLVVDVTLRPVIKSQPLSMTVNSGVPILLGVVVDGAGMSYQWFKDGITLPGATSELYSVQRSTMADSGRYWCMVTNICGVTKSDTAIIRVRLGTWVNENDSTAIGIRVITQQPANEVLQLECYVPCGLLTVYLTDLTGRVVLQPFTVEFSPGERQQVTIPVAHLASGVLIVTVQSEAGAISVPALILH